MFKFNLIVLAALFSFDFWCLDAKYTHMAEETAIAFLHHVFGF